MKIPNATANDNQGNHYDDSPLYPGMTAIFCHKLQCFGRPMIETATGNDKLRDFPHLSIFSSTRIKCNPVHFPL